MNLESYIEYFYPYNPDVAESMKDTHLEKIKEKNPLLFVDDLYSEMRIGFRFFDINSGMNPYIQNNRKNISHIYYYGRYLTKEEVDHIHEIMPYTNKNPRMISCYCGYLATELNKEDIALEEYVNSILVEDNSLQLKP